MRCLRCVDELLIKSLQVNCSLEVVILVSQQGLPTVCSVSLRSISLVLILILPQYKYALIVMSADLWDLNILLFHPIGSLSPFRLCGTRRSPVKHWR